MNRPVCIIGTGYVGMACMIGLADLGWTVHGYDIVPERIERLRAGMPPYREDGLQESLKKHVADGRMHFFHSLDEAARDSEIVLVAVGTPSRDDGSADMSALESALKDLAGVKFAAWPTIVIRSTVPPGTCDGFAPFVEKWGELVFAPEFLREGSAVRDFLNPSRIVVGARKSSIGVPYVQSLRSPSEAGRLHLALQRRIGQVLLQCVSRDEGHVRQRGREPVRRARREFGRRPAGNRVRPAHRSRVPPAGHRLRRALLRKGRQEHPPRRDRARLGPRALFGDAARERVAADARRGSNLPRNRQPRRYDDRRLGPRLQSGNRRHPQLAGPAHRRRVCKPRRDDRRLRPGRAPRAAPARKPARPLGARSRRRRRARRPNRLARVRARSIR